MGIAVPKELDAGGACIFFSLAFSCPKWHIAGYVGGSDTPFPPPEHGSVQGAKRCGAGGVPQARNGAQATPRRADSGRSRSAPESSWQSSEGQVEPAAIGLFFTPRSSPAAAAGAAGPRR